METSKNTISIEVIEPSGVDDDFLCELAGPAIKASTAAVAHSQERERKAGINLSEQTSETAEEASLLLFSSNSAAPKTAISSDLPSKCRKSASKGQSGKTAAPSQVKLQHQSGKTAAPPAINLVLIYNHHGVAFTHRLVYSACLEHVINRFKSKDYAGTVELIPSIRALSRRLLISNNTVKAALDELEQLQLIERYDKAAIVTKPKHNFFVPRDGRGIPHWSSTIAYMTIDPARFGRINWRLSAVLTRLEFLSQTTNTTSMQSIANCLGMNVKTVKQSIRHATKSGWLKVQTRPNEGITFEFADTKAEQAKEEEVMKRIRKIAGNS